MDPWFFVETAPELTPLIYNSRSVNDAQPRFVVETIRRAAGSLKGKKIAALGLAYKPDVDDLRESPASEVVRLLQAEGAKVKAWEPFKPEANLPGIDMAASLEAALKDADAIVLLVRHTEFINLKPSDISAKTGARLVDRTVNGWDADEWEAAGFKMVRLGVGK